MLADPQWHCPLCEVTTKGYVLTEDNLTGRYYIVSTSGHDEVRYMDARHPVFINEPICEHCDGLLVAALELEKAA